MTNIIRTTLLLGILTGLMLLIGGVLGGRGGMFFALVLSVIMNFGAYWYSDKIVLKMYHAKEITPAESSELFEMVNNLAMQAHLPMPKVYIVQTPMANAFATGRDPKHAAVAV